MSNGGFLFKRANGLTELRSVRMDADKTSSSTQVDGLPTCGFVREMYYHCLDLTSARVVSLVSGKATLSQPYQPHPYTSLATGTRVLE